MQVSFSSGQALRRAASACNPCAEAKVEGPKTIKLGSFIGRHSQDLAYLEDTELFSRLSLGKEDSPWFAVLSRRFDIVVVSHGSGSFLTGTT